MSFKKYVGLMLTRDIQDKIDYLEGELACTYDGWSGIVDKRRSQMKETLNIYEEEMIERILLKGNS